MIANSTKTYFEDNASSWITDGYTNQGYNYPTPAHRLRVIENILKKFNHLKNALDVGCGGGHVSLALAKHGLKVDSIDMSQSMLETAHKNINEHPRLKENITLHQSDLDNFSGSNYDIIVAMGLIGYLPSDAHFFDIASKKINNNGHVLISFRNHLFNLFSISDNTQKDCDLGRFAALRQEFNEFSQQITKDQTKTFLQDLQQATQKALDMLEESELTTTSNREALYSGSVQPRQSTPQQVIKDAAQYGFQLEKMVGVHPHLSLPGLNKMMPEGIYNILSDALISLEEHPQALRWSSVCVGLFKQV